MILKYLIQKEFIQIRRNSFLPKLIILYPIIIMCVIPWVMSMEIKNIRVDVIDYDHSSLSNRLTQRIASGNYFIFNAHAGSYADALQDIERGDADVLVSIPRGYSKGVVILQNDRELHNLPQVLITVNAANAMKGSMGMAYLTNIVVDNLAEAMQIDYTALRSRVEVLYLYNKNLNYKVFMIPALMGILMMMICGFLPTLNIVSEKEKGSIEQINVTPVDKITFIAAKLIPYFIIGIVVMTICFLLSWLVYGIICQGPWFVVYLIAVLLALIYSGLGLIISNYSDTMQQAIFVMWFIVVCMMLLSGIFTPVASMPLWAQQIVKINPMHYFTDAIRTVFVRGGSLSDVSSQMLCLAVMAIVLDGWAVISYKKNG